MAMVWCDCIGIVMGILVVKNVVNCQALVAFIPPSELFDSRAGMALWSGTPAALEQPPSRPGTTRQLSSLARSSQHKQCLYFCASYKAIDSLDKGILISTVPDLG